MNRNGQTTNFSVSDYLKELVRFMGKDLFDYIIVNKQQPPRELIEIYAQEGTLVSNDLIDSRVIEADLLGEIGKQPIKDLIKRNLIRHDSEKLAQELMKIVNHL